MLASTEENKSLDLRGEEVVGSNAARAGLGGKRPRIRAHTGRADISREVLTPATETQPAGIVISNVGAPYWIPNDHAESLEAGQLALENPFANVLSGKR